MKPTLFFALLACAVAGLVRAAAPVDAPAPTPAPTPAPGPPPTDVVFFGHDQVHQTFWTGGSLLVNERYKVQCGRRVIPGSVEIHTRDTDVFYILDGSATFVTGGTAVDQKTTAPGEIRAKSITGGTERHLAKGDIIVIPHGIPHQFTQVSGPFLYFVVKVTQ
jgi:mannose-6-phosphate isomerase-like protein (cupin superfamily)